MIQSIQIFGERRSGTNYLANLVQTNFRDVKLTNEFGGKHWFVKDHHPRSKNNETTDNQCIRSLADSDDTLFMVIYRNPVNWLRAIHHRPFHANEHYSLSFSEFIRKPWKSFSNEKLNPNWRSNDDQYYEIEDAENVVTLRSLKIEHWENLTAFVKNICFLNYEYLNDDPDVLAQIAESFAIPLTYPLIMDQHLEMGGGVKDRRGFVQRQYEPISEEDGAFISRHLNPELEARVGYNFSQSRGILEMQTCTGMPPRIFNQHFKPNIPTSPIVTESNSPLLDLTLHIRGLEPLTLCGTEDLPVVQQLFRAMLANSMPGSEHASSELIYLEIGEDTPKALYFPASNLVSIESSPPVSAEFLQSLT
ncbi:MAG: hypothetical protein AAF353_00800 [Pseudomonadota bacterium]